MIKDVIADLEHEAEAVERMVESLRARWLLGELPSLDELKRWEKAPSMEVTVECLAVHQIFRGSAALLLRGRRRSLVTDNLFFAGPLASQLMHPGRKPLFLGDTGNRGDPIRQTPAVQKKPEAS